MDNDSQFQGGRVRCTGGVPNYQKDILISIVKQYLPQGLEAWREVTLAYQRESMEATLRRGENLWDNWNRKLCNRMQKPTGKPGATSDRIFQCMAIEHRIQDEANASILGADSAESSHFRDDGNSALSDVVADDAYDDVGDDGDEDDDEVAAVNTEDENAAVVATASPRPQLLPAFIGGRVGASCAVSTSASRGGVTCKTNTPVPPRISPTSLSNTSSRGGRGGEKTKNSTNCEWGSILKAMDRVAKSIQSGGGGGQ
jgi:hypothetical protein